MFGPKTKSKTVTTTAATNELTKNPSKGLLSFNTSNFTKIFKNPSNFVHTTFGSVAATISNTDDDEDAADDVPPFTVPASASASRRSFYASNNKYRTPSNDNAKYEKVIATTSTSGIVASLDKCSAPLGRGHSRIASSNNASPESANGDTMNEVNSKRAHLQTTTQMVRNNNEITSATAYSPNTRRRTIPSNSTSTMNGIPKEATSVDNSIAMSSTMPSSPVIFETVRRDRIPSATRIDQLAVATPSHSHSPGNSELDGNRAPNNNNIIQLINRSCATSRMTDSTSIESKLAYGAGGLKAYANQLTDDLGRNGNAINADNEIKNVRSVSDANANNNIDFSSKQEIEAIHAFKTNRFKQSSTMAGGDGLHASMVATTIDAYDKQRANDQPTMMIEQNQCKQQYDVRPQQTAYQTWQLNNGAHATPSAADGNENVILTSVTPVASPNSSHTGIGGCTVATVAASTTPASANNGGNNNIVVANKYEQNFILPRSIELHDIQEELYTLDAIENNRNNPFAGTGKSWNSLPVHKYANYFGSTMVDQAVSPSYVNNNKLTATAAVLFGAAASHTITPLPPPPLFNGSNPFLSWSTTAVSQPAITSLSPNLSPMAIGGIASATTTGDNSSLGATYATDSDCLSATTSIGTVGAAAACYGLSSTIDYGSAGDNNGNDHFRHCQQRIFNSATVAADDEDILAYNAHANLHSDPITPETMHILQLFFRQPGSECMQEFLQVINIVLAIPFWVCENWLDASERARAVRYQWIIEGKNTDTCLWYLADETTASMS